MMDTMCAETQKGTQTLNRAGVLPAQCPLWVKRELMELSHLMCAQARMQLGLFISTAPTALGGICPAHFIVEAGSAQDPCFTLPPPRIAICAEIGNLVLSPRLYKFCPITRPKAVSLLTNESNTNTEGLPIPAMY
ncbi:hypothetical protein U0070_021302 [Myodes glareolus]|uniref:Uncharacterized protein n=1 Tax=Myodes glareolus TaxID=447135 RepID=A0AAW0JHZ5_MYOGA